MSYQPIELSILTEDDSEPIVTRSHLEIIEDSSPYSPRKTFRNRYRIIELAVLLLCCSISFELGTHRSQSQARIELPQLPLHSEGHQRLMQWNISSASPSIYLDDPSPAVDAAWDKTERLNILRASASELHRAGTNPHAVPLPDDGYMASLEVVYHMHCLNFLRKASFVDHEHYKNDPVFQDPLFPVGSRIRTCVDVLRHVLACHADENLMAFYWVEGYSRPYPNFNTWHVCSDYEAIIARADSHKVPPPTSWKEWRTENVTEFSAPLEAEEHPRPSR